MKLSLSMVYKILRNGELECYPIGSVYRVIEHQLGRYLDRVKGQAKAVTRIKRHFYAVISAARMRKAWRIIPSAFVFYAGASESIRLPPFQPGVISYRFALPQPIVPQ